MSDTNNIMFQAALQKLRFSTNRGQLRSEDLFDVPLQSRDGFDLDTAAKAISRQLKEAAEESFVETSTNPAKAKLELQLEVIKAVIAYKVEQHKAREAAASRKAERAKLVNLLGEKQDEALKTLTQEEIQKRLAELDKAG
jgi:hypothetical protein